MKRPLCLLLLASGALAQIQPCSLPTLFAYVQGWQGATPPVTVAFQCSNLAAIPALMGLACPQPVTIPADVLPGQQVYFGYNPLADAPLHVAASFPGVTCAGPCSQDSTPMPYIGEYTIGIYTVGQGILPTWTGAPSLPVVTVLGNCNDPIIAYKPGAITVTCQ